MSTSQRTILGSSVVPLRLTFFMWLLFMADFVYGFNLTAFGIHPRSLSGLIGIITAPVLHANLTHIISNTVPLLFLGAVLFFFYARIASAVFLRCYFFTNILVWLFARSANHIGASGLIYGLAFFLMSFGIFRRDFFSLLVSLVIIFFFSYLFYGILPSNPYVSWESHLFGAVVGVTTAISFSKLKKVYR